MKQLPEAQSLPILSVSQLNEQVSYLLEQSFPYVALEAEISNFSTPRSGHWYFTLKDDKAQVRCAMFRFHNQRSQIRPEEGQQVLVHGRVSLYEARGDYQIIIEHMQQAGVGRLQAAFEELKQRLKQEGLFEAQYKKALPRIPQRIVLITSNTGAAIQDIQNVLDRRAPYLSIHTMPVLVQGETAAPSIVEALQKADEQRWADVIMLARGGGSLEDLWCFNDERLARAIFACHTPIITGIGHETDFTISDFVADLRTPTPSAAAEQVAPDYQTLLQTIAQYARQLEKHTLQHLQKLQQQFDGQYKRLQQAHPVNMIHQQKQRLDILRQRLQHWQQQCTQQYQQQLTALQYRLQAQHPRQTSQQIKQHLQQLQKTLQQSIQQHYLQTLNRFNYLQRCLDALSPQATLERGYAIVKDDQNNLIRDAQNLKPQQPLTIELANSWVYSQVSSTQQKSKK